MLFISSLLKWVLKGDKTSSFLFEMQETSKSPLDRNKFGGVLQN